MFPDSDRPRLVPVKLRLPAVLFVLSLIGLSVFGTVLISLIDMSGSVQSLEDDAQELKGQLDERIQKSLDSAISLH